MAKKKKHVSHRRRLHRRVRPRYVNPFGAELAGMDDIGEYGDLGDLGALTDLKGILKDATNIDEVKSSALLALSGGAGFALGSKAIKKLIDPTTGAFAQYKDYIRAVVAFLGGHVLRIAARRAGGMIAVVGDGFGAGLAIAAGAHIMQSAMKMPAPVLSGVDEDKLLMALSDLGDWAVPESAWGSQPAIAGADYEELPMASLEADVAPSDLDGFEEGYPLDADVELVDGIDGIDSVDADLESVDGLV